MADPDRHPVGGPAGGGAGSWADLSRLCAAAETALAEGSLDEAEALYAVVLDREPEHTVAQARTADMRHRRALALERQGRLEDALECCRAALAVQRAPGAELQTTLRSLLVRVARDHEHRGDAAAALGLIEESVGIARREDPTADLTLELDGEITDGSWAVLVARAGLTVHPDPRRAADLVALLARHAESLLPDGIEEAIALHREAARLVREHRLPHDVAQQERFAALLIGQARLALDHGDMAEAVDLATEASRMDPGIANDEELLSRMVVAAESQGLHAPAAGLARMQYEREPDRIELGAAAARLLRRAGDACRADGDAAEAAQFHREALRIERTRPSSERDADRDDARATLPEHALVELAQGSAAKAGTLLAAALGPDSSASDVAAALIGLTEVSTQRRIAAVRELMALRPSPGVGAALAALLHERAHDLDAQGEAMRARHAYREALAVQRRAGGLGAAPILCAEVARVLGASTRALLEIGDVAGGLASYTATADVARHSDDLEADPSLEGLVRAKALEVADRRLQASEVIAAAELARDLGGVSGERGEVQRMIGRILRVSAGGEDWSAVLQVVSASLSADADLVSASAAQVGREALSAERRGDDHAALHYLRRARELAGLGGEQLAPRFAEAHLRVLVRLAEHRVAAGLFDAALGPIEEIKALAPGDNRLATLERAVHAAGETTAPQAG